MKNGFSILFLLIIFWSQLSFARYVPYIREHILTEFDVSKSGNLDLLKDQTWENLKEAQLEAVAEILGLYPNHEIYFLARDAELLYDLAVLLTEGKSSYLHLLNVSRVSSKSKNLRAYLTQEGISDEVLKSKNIVLVDTGFAGTIPIRILNEIHEDYRYRIKTHLLVSGSKEFPSMRTFLTSINPAAAYFPADQMHGTIIKFEHMPHETDRSVEFEQIDGRWYPMSSDSVQQDGNVNKEMATLYRIDLRLLHKKMEFKEGFKSVIKCGVT